jgi:hypothetical protein
MKLRTLHERLQKRRNARSKNMILTDKVIRNELVKFLNTRKPRPNIVMEELRVHNGNAIADVVAVYNTAHCFEIKGESDKLTRVKRQAKFYNTTFLKITLVTTPNHASTAEKQIPKFWGILVADNAGKKITFSYVRKAKHNSAFSKPLALSMLWRSELINIATRIEASGLRKRLTRAEIADYISKNRSKEEVISDVTRTILNRYKVGKMS